MPEPQAADSGDRSPRVRPAAVSAPGLARALPYRSRARSYAFFAALLSQGAPAAAIALCVMGEGMSREERLAEHGLMFVHMSLRALALFTAFGYCIGRLADQLVAQRHALRSANRRLRWLSDVDPLTGTLNRRAIRRQLRLELRRARRADSATALVLLDLDHFKQINDRHGHAAGDRVLRRVGRRLRRLARAGDSVGRMGGEEFLMVLPATSLPQAVRLAERVRVALAQCPGDPAIPSVTASLGVSATMDSDALDIDTVVGRADAAMYRAKSEGRNRVCRASREIFDDDVVRSR